MNEYRASNEFAYIKESEITVLDCLKWFDKGFENIYLLDDNLRYMGYVIKRNDFYKLFDNNDNWIASVERKIVVQTRDFDKEEIVESNKDYLQGNSIPVIYEDSIVGCIEKTEKEKIKVNWSLIGKSFSHFYVKNHYKSIYMSSFENEDMVNLYNFLKQMQLQVIVLENQYFEEALRDKEGLILSSLAIDSARIWGIYDLYALLLKSSCDSIGNLMEIRYQWAEVHIDNCEERENLWKCFDLGYRTVVIVDENGKYKGLLPLNRYNVFKQVKSIDGLYVEDSDEKSNRFNAALQMLAWDCDEIPVLKDGIVKYVLCRCCGIKRKSMFELQKSMPMRWELISDKTAEMVLGKDPKRIMVLSDCKNAHDFANRFSSKYEITFYDYIYKYKVLSNYYDVNIYVADIWIKGINYKSLYQLYLDMLSLEMYMYLSRNRVQYIYVCMSNEQRIYNREYRNGIFAERVEKNHLLEAKFDSMFGEYYYWNDISDENYNVKAGRRVTCGKPEKSDGKIFVFGPCTVFGVYANDKETIPSILQHIVINKKMNYEVVNCGILGNDFLEGNDISNCNFILDTKVRPGDIVIQFGQKMWLENLEEMPEHIIKESNIFDTSELKCKSIWEDYWNAHVAVEYYPYIAQYLADYIENKIMYDVNFVNKKAIPSIYEEKHYVREIINSELRDYIATIKNIKTLECGEEKIIGAIVMNANPFTKGHEYLVLQALKQVDFLYVFVVQEDKSEFLFEDRLKMVELNCEKFPNVIVLPSGKFIISSITFSEYFIKESIQEQQVMPSNDLRIFSRVIAPELGIKKRFVGEEPFDKITKQYNVALKEILPEWGIELVEIPRLLSKSKAISATETRKLLSEDLFEECEEFLTEETLLFIRENPQTLSKLKEKYN